MLNQKLATVYMLQLLIINKKLAIPFCFVAFFAIPIPTFKFTVFIYLDRLFTFYNPILDRFCHYYMVVAMKQVQRS